MNYANHNMRPEGWDKNTVSLRDLFVDDCDTKRRDALANAGDFELVTYYAAMNRLIARSDYSAAYEEDEIRSYQRSRNFAFEEILKRMKGCGK